MENVSIILTYRQCTGNNDVEVIVECEKEYRPLALTGCAVKITDMARLFGGSMIPWIREPEFQKFCYVFRFQTEEMKRGFLKRISELA